MNKETGNFAHKFKKTGAPSGVDSRTVRAHQRSVEWKQSREQEVARRRNVKPMSPVAEIQNKNQEEQGLTAANAKGRTNDRRAQLLKWKEEKELKKKMEELEKAKKKPFRVVHLEPDAFPIKKSAAAASAVQKKTAGNNKPEISTGRNTRSKGAAAVSSTETAVATRAKASSSLAGKKVEQQQKEKSKPPVKTRDAKKATKPVPAVPEKATRSSTRTAVAPNTAKATAVAGKEPVVVLQNTIPASDADVMPSSSDRRARVFDFSYSRAGKVNMNRGAESFAPADFQFTAPENLKSFSFSRLNSSNRTPQNENNEMSSNSQSKSKSRSGKKYDIFENSTPTYAKSVSSQESPETVAINDCVVALKRLPESLMSQLQSNSGGKIRMAPGFSLMNVAELEVNAKERSSSGSLSAEGKSHPSFAGTEGYVNDNEELVDVRKSSRSDKKRGRSSTSTKSPTKVQPFADNESAKEDTGMSATKRRRTAKNETVATEEEPVVSEEISNTTKGSRRKSVRKIARAVETESAKESGDSSPVVPRRGQRSRKSTAFTDDDKAGKGRSAVMESHTTVPSATTDDAKEFTENGNLSVDGETKIAGRRRRSVRKSIRFTEPESYADILETQESKDDAVPMDSTNEVAENENSSVNREVTGSRARSSRKSARFNVERDSSAVSEMQDSVDDVPAEPSKKVKLSESRRKSTRRSVVGKSSRDDEAVTEKHDEANFKTNKELNGSKIVNSSITVENNQTGIGADSGNEAVFQTPRQPIKSLRPRSTAVGLDSAKRKTPRNFRNSLILRALSPEEGVEILKNSPMIELNRRKIKSPEATPGSGNVNVAPMPNFDDLDLNDANLMAKAKFTDEENSAVLGQQSSVVAPTVDENGPTESKEDGVLRFRQLLISETSRLTSLCSLWKETLESDSDLINDDIGGLIRMAVGKAELLMAQRFKQFSGLVDDCEFNTSEKEVTCTDLQGFWDMIYYQVEDVDKKFCDLEKLKASNWIVEKPVAAVKPRAVKKKAADVAKPDAAKKTSARPNFAEFRKKLQHQQQGQVNENGGGGSVVGISPTAETKTFDGGFFKVDSPVHKTTETSAARRSGISMAGNTPKATSMARDVLQKMTRKSLVLSMEDCCVNPKTPSEKSAASSKPDSCEKPKADVNKKATSSGSDQKGTKTRRSMRKSVCFSEVVYEADAVDFNKYLMSSTGDGDGLSTPRVSHYPDDDTFEVNNTPLVNFEADDVPVSGFKGLKLGFTPGVDGKSRRVSGFTPLRKSDTVSTMDTISESADADLMTFGSASGSGSAVTEDAELSDGKKDTPAKARRSIRRSVSRKSHASLL